jgi:Flp pilus assembly pilin Flp
MRRFRQHFKGDQSGSLAIEYAFVLPVLLMLILGTLEFSIMLFTRSSIENTMANVARQAMAGDSWTTPDGTPRGTYYQNLLEEELSKVVMTPGQLEVSAPVSFARWYEWVNDIGRPQQDFGRPYQIVEYTATYRYEWLTPLGMLADLASGETVLMSTVFIRNDGNS